MDTKKISPRQYQFLQKALQNWVDEEALAADQAVSLLAGYEPVRSVSFIRVLTAIGSLLIGVGVLSFIASNWDIMSRPLKLAVLIGFFAAFNLGGYLVRNLYPRTASALFYVAALIYGAGIFLIEQMYHFSANTHSSFLLWSVGLIPLAVLRRDMVLSVFSLGLTAVWLTTATLDAQQFPWLGFLPVLPLVLAYWQKKNELLLFCMTAVGLLWTLLALNELDLDGLWVALFFFALSLAFLYQKSLTLNIQGNLLMGISGLFLTFPDLWNLSHQANASSAGAISFAIGFGLYLLWRIQKGSLFAIALICGLIVRYYVDLTYDFLPKSVFFIIGGVILLGFGYSFERRRRKGGLTHEL